MLCEERLEVRDLAVNRILAARSATNNKKRRVFRVPDINFKAKDYTEMINWKKVVITEPPLTFRMSESELRSVFQNRKEIPSFNLPCHTQNVEKCVKVLLKIFNIYKNSV